jgi:hypothetical protein
MLILTFMFVMLSIVSGEVPFKDLEEVRRGKAKGLIVNKCHPGDEPLSGALPQISYCLGILPIIYNLERLPCEPSHKYRSMSLGDLRDLLYVKLKSANRYLPHRSNLARLVRNQICNMENNESNLPHPDDSGNLSEPEDLLAFKCTLSQVAIEYSEKVTDKLLKAGGARK